MKEERQAPTGKGRPAAMKTAQAKATPIAEIEVVGEDRREHGGSLLDFALRQRCWQNLRPEPCQEIRPVGLVMKDRLLVVATSGDVGEGPGYSTLR